MKLALPAFVALAIAVAAPTYAAVVSGGASGTAASAAAEQTITPHPEGGITQNSTAQSTPVSHATDDAFSCFGSDSKSAPPEGMRDLVQNFCDVNAGKTLQSGKPGPSVNHVFSPLIPHLIYTQTLGYVALPFTDKYGYGGTVPVRLGIGAGIDCSTVIERNHCKAEMGGIIDACGKHGGSIYHPN
ncbi:hypothetical protein DFH06DRAFT_1310975, partial [Mycena polygramma]